MFDLHSHILPGIDDGASGVEQSLEMARMYVAQSVHCVACTPHILPGVYHNVGPQIREAVLGLQAQIDAAGMPLLLVPGADNHIIPEFVDGLRTGRLLTIADSRYVLVEPPHHSAPARLSELFFSILVAGYVPILTHPERLSWIESRFDVIEQMAERGVWMQITAGSLAGAFGRRVRYWADRMVGEGMVQILATDAHDPRKRPPDLAAGYLAAERLVGSTEARHLVYTRPRAILLNGRPNDLPTPTKVPLKDDGANHEERPEPASAAGGGGFSRRLRGLFG
ncbi:MAG: CpsB/CapC family capsule biosynthesis tyrosine phosphatase [Hyphomicrobiaceae bacterium]